MILSENTKQQQQQNNAPSTRSTISQALTAPEIVWYNFGANNHTNCGVFSSLQPREKAGGLGRLDNLTNGSRYVEAAANVVFHRSLENLNRLQHHVGSEFALDFLGHLVLLVYSEHSIHQPGSVGVYPTFLVGHDAVELYRVHVVLSSCDSARIMQCHPACLRQVRYHCDGIPQFHNCLASHASSKIS